MHRFKCLSIGLWVVCIRPVVTTHVQSAGTSASSHWVVSLDSLCSINVAIGMLSFEHTVSIDAASIGFYLIPISRLSEMSQLTTSSIIFVLGTALSVAFSANIN